MSASWPKAATSCRARSRPTSTSSPRARTNIDGIVAAQVEKIAEGRDILSRALKADLVGIDNLVESQIQKFADGRNSISQVLETDVEKLKESRAGRRRHGRRADAAAGQGRETLAQALEADLAGINGLLTSHVEKFADGRAGLTQALQDDLDKLPRAAAASTAWSPARSRSSPRAATSSSARWKPTSTSCEPSTSTHRHRQSKSSPKAANLARALEADLDKLAETRANIDSIVASQVEKLAEGRDILTGRSKPISSKLAESRCDDRRPSSPARSQKFAEGRDMLTKALEDDLNKLAESRSGIDGLVPARSRSWPRAATS